ncbi:cation diffusion facilitator family transporter [Pseudochrobactrum sp. MP213Fo]|uniref:cation diffusion facilitator family transporter n=1 Tax=Pseudochrobactrum sp. MP213Fo TaxID=3022250 RepID=UPI003BA06013
MATGSQKVIYAALVGNTLIAVTKFIASAITGSSAMLSEAVHSLVDTGNEILLLYGLKRAAKPADEQHPLGYGREIYFWSFIVALLVFALGAGISFYEGVMHILNPVPVRNITVNYIVLGFSMLFEFYSWRLALKEFRRRKGRFSYLSAFKRSKDPTVFTVLFEDSAALLGLLVALIGITLAHWLDMPVLDGVASIGIALILTMTAVFLARECKGLLMGEPALPEVQQAIRAIAGADPDVIRVNSMLTVHVGPQQILTGLSLEFDDHMDTTQIENCVMRLEEKLRAAHPEVQAIFIKPQAATTAPSRGRLQLH